MHDPSVWFLEIPATAKEVFTSPTIDGRVYELTVSGTYQFTYIRFIFEKEGSADALFFVDKQQNYTQRYPGLAIDGRSVTDHSVEQLRNDRYLHRYVFRLDGTGDRFVIKLTPPKCGWSKGCLELKVARLGATVVTRKAKLEAERGARESENLALQAAALVAERKAAREQRRRLRQEAAANAEEEERQIAAIKQEQEAVIQAEVRKLALRVHQDSNVFDEQYRQRFVHKHRDELLGELGESWSAEYEKVMTNNELVSALQSLAQDVIVWFELRVEMVLAAQRSKVAPPELPAMLTGPIPLTIGTAGNVQYCIGQLLQLRRDVAKAREQAAYQGDDDATRPVLEQAGRVAAFHLRELQRYGIDVEKPEDAMEQLHTKLPAPKRPVKRRGRTTTPFYKKLHKELNSGKTKVADAIVERLKDLYHEQVILSAKRRAYVQGIDAGTSADIDARLADIRREMTGIKRLLDRLNIQVVLGDQPPPQNLVDPNSRQQRVIGLNEEKKAIIAELKKEGDLEPIDHVEALYAQELVKLFEVDSERYA